MEPTGLHAYRQRRRSPAWILHVTASFIASSAYANGGDFEAVVQAVAAYTHWPLHRARRYVAENNAGIRLGARVIEYATEIAP